MQVSDPYVLRVIINSAGIESTYVARTRAELDNILLSTGRGGFGWSADLYTVRRFPLVSSLCFRGMRLISWCIQGGRWFIEPNHAITGW